MFGLGPWEIGIIALVIVAVFGTAGIRRFTQLGKEAIKAKNEIAGAFDEVTTAGEEVIKAGKKLENDLTS